jgi:hypothetical protein
MKLEYKHLEAIIFGKMGFRRFTQDSSILPDVWMEFGEKPHDQADLLLTPTWGSAPGSICYTIQKRLESDEHLKRQRFNPSDKKEKPWALAYNGSTVALRLYFDEMIRVILPITYWWEKYIKESPLSPKNKENFLLLKKIIDENDVRESLSTLLEESEWDINVANDKLKNQEDTSSILGVDKLPPPLIWLIKIVGVISLAQMASSQLKITISDEESFLNENTADIVRAFVDIIRPIFSKPADAGKFEPRSDTPEESTGIIWAINLNRKASAMIWRSSAAVKADASRRLFQVNCEDIRWAIIDSGIDATHPAFRKKKPDGTFPKPFENGENWTRIEKTFDFTPIRAILSQDSEEIASLSEKFKARYESIEEEDLKALRERLRNGRALDWDVLAPLLEISHTDDKYSAPTFEHGTHVAGIMAADWKFNKDDEKSENEFDIQGVCPDLVLYDLRVLNEKGEGDEFSVLAALQFAKYINTNSKYKRVHGVNLSLSIRHKVKNFACGCTPVCEEAERLVDSGLIVVAAAGNDGYLESSGGGSLTEGYRSISITDPGNAQSVITVGSTHRDSPHTYGVSYFSSRGPTGDGRIKPDLVAPGEKITSTVPDHGLKTMDGTSMAAPHVSGAAALLIGRNRELINNPQRVKEILCKTATDLGRERYFQGSGMLDILRAMQSV